MNRRSFSDIMLVVVLVLTSAHILAVSMSDYYGYLNPDSTRYMSVAENLASGYGFTLVDYFTPGGRSYFTMQPVGYPALLFALKAILPGVSLFLVSKLLNILCVALILLCFRLISREKAYLYAMLLFGMEYLELFSYSLTETPFIALLLVFVLLIRRLLGSELYGILTTAAIGLTLIGLFLLRYIGLFAAGAVIVFAIAEYKRGHKKHAAALASAAGVAIVFAAMYFLNNYMRTSTLTGNHVPAPEAIPALLLRLATAQLYEMNLFVSYGASFKRTLIFAITMVLEIAVAWWFIRRWGIGTKKAAPGTSAGAELWRIGVMTAGVYWFSLFFLRLSVHFDVFYFRTLAPATFLLFVALVNYIETRFDDNAVRDFAKLWTAGLACSFILGSPLYLFDVIVIDKTKPYSVHEARFKEKYAAVPEGSMVGLADDFIRFLRPDCQPVYPLNPDYNDEEFAAFTERIMRTDAPSVYLEILPVDKYKKWNRTVEEFLTDNKEKDFVRLR